MAKKTYRVVPIEGLELDEVYQDFFQLVADWHKLDVYVGEYDYLKKKPNRIAELYPEAKKNSLWLIFGATGTQEDSLHDKPYPHGVRTNNPKIAGYNPTTSVHSVNAANAPARTPNQGAWHAYHNDGTRWLSMRMIDVKFIHPEWTGLRDHPAVVCYAFLVDCGVIDRITLSQLVPTTPFAKACLGTISSAQARRQEGQVIGRIDGARDRLSALLTEMVETESNLRVDQSLLLSLQSIKVQPPDISPIIDHPLVSTLGLVLSDMGTNYPPTKDLFKITTKPIGLRMPGGTLPLGSYHICFSVGTPDEAGRLIFFSHVSEGDVPTGSHSFHPHLSMDGNPCFGGFTPTIAGALSSLDLPVLLDTLKAWLEQYNPASRHSSPETVAYRLGIHIHESEWMSTREPVTAPAREEAAEAAENEEEPIEIVIN